LTASDSEFRETEVSDHPSVEAIAAYLSGKMSAEAVVALEAHLSNCRECRTEVTSARRLIKERSSPHRHWLIPGIAAAVLLIGVLMKPTGSSHVERASRKQSADGRETIALVSPAGEVGARGLVFSWRSAGAEARYALSLSDSAGNAVWESQTSDTSLALPQSIRLLPGSMYLWYVDASAPNGMTATSGVRSFRTTP